MAKTKILKEGWAKVPNAYYLAAMRATKERCDVVEIENAPWLTLVSRFNTTFKTLDDAYQLSLLSLSTQTIAEKDDERDTWGQVIEQVSKQWARMPDETMALHGRRVYQVFRDIDFRTSEALVVENEKEFNIQQRFQETQLADDLKAMGLTEANRRFAQLTLEIITLMSQRNEENAKRVQGELKAAREAMDAVYSDFVELTNALIVVGGVDGLEQLAQLLNADYKKIEEQMEQSKKLPTVLVKSDVVGNHRYSVPEYAKWTNIVSANSKAFAVDDATGYIVSLAAKASKVGGLYLTLGGVAVKPTDLVDAKKEYSLVTMDGGSSDVTPVTPE